MVGKITGKHQLTPIRQLPKNNDTITDKKTIRHLEAEIFSKNSSNQNSNQEFTTVKQNAEKF